MQRPLILQGDALAMLRTLPDASVQACVTSPPYYALRDYGMDGQIGLEDTPDAYVQRLVDVFREVRRVLKDDGTLWVNIGDSYASGGRGGGGSFVEERKAWSGRESVTGWRSPPRGLKHKDLIGIPWMLAFALRTDGWHLRQDIIWHKPNPMPESVTDRCTKAHEYVFLLSKSPRYYMSPDGMKEPAVGGQHPSALQFGRQGKSSEHVLPGQNAAQHRPRPQYERAQALAQQAGLTAAHIAAIRAVGLSDAGKAQATQTGAGQNDPQVQALADEAKAALGGYYREFLGGDTRNRRSVWSIATKPFSEAHFAVMPAELAETCILASTRPGDTVLDPFMGAFTTAYAALLHGRRAIGTELNPDYIAIGEKRIAPFFDLPLFEGLEVTA